MHLKNKIWLLLIPLAIWQLTACGPKKVSTADEKLQNSSKDWIPYTGTEELVYIYDTNKLVFTSSGKETFFDNIRYMSDQSGFVTVQEDYYADMERQLLIFDSPSTPYFLKYYLERNKGDTGDWDILKVSVGDGDYYKNEMKIVTYETDSYDKGEYYVFKKSKLLNGITFDSVYLWKQKRRPFEIYYTAKQGIVAFKVSSTELWVIQSDTIK